MTGSVVAIYVTAEAAAPMRPVDEVEALAGTGLAGDRYAASAGTWSDGGDDHRPRRQLTLIESEAVEAVRREHGIDLDPSETRRNVVTSGVALNDLVGREFDVGEVRVRGVQLCEPCRHLEELVGRAVMAPLVHRGGLNAEILTSGRIRVGDAVVTP